MQEENWKAVVGYEGLYEISDHGRVRSLDRPSRNRYGSFQLRGRLKAQHTNANGYLYLRLSQGGKERTATVHVLVAKAFLAPCGKPWVNHKDFNRTNNRVENLEWVTPHENATHARVAGRMGKRLTLASVQSIRECRARTGRTLESIAKEFGVTLQNVSQILRHEIWK